MNAAHWLEATLFASVPSLQAQAPAEKTQTSTVQEGTNPPVDDSDNTMTFVGVGFGVLLLLLLVFFMTSARNKRAREINAIDDSEQARLPKPEEPEGPSVSVREFEDRKEELGLSDIKRAKKATAEPEMSRAEVRELRRARRADTQTQRATEEESDPAAPIKELDEAPPEEIGDTAPLTPKTPPAAKPTPADDDDDDDDWDDDDDDDDLAPTGPESVSERLKSTRKDGVISKIRTLFGRRKLDEDTIEELEMLLFTADIGVKTAQDLLAAVENEVAHKRIEDADAALNFIRARVLEILKSSEQPLIVGKESPHVVLIIGVNGAGKTTTIGKMASKFKEEGNKVLLIAGDTFRAAAIEQLEEWGHRTGCEVFRGEHNADPSAVIFDGLEHAKRGGFDLVLADTAGRLHNKKTLIDELKKIHRVTGKAIKHAPHRVLLVLDSTNGQNALRQAEAFNQAIECTGLILTKLDGTAKGGMIIGVCHELKKPVHFIGIGERVDDLRPFEAEEFVDALF